MAVVAEAISIAKDVGELIGIGGTKKLFSASQSGELTFGGMCGTEPPIELWAYAWEAASGAEKSNIEKIWRANFGTRPFLPVSQGFLTQAFSGGNDCKISNGGDRAMNAAVVALIEKYAGSASFGEAQLSGNAQRNAAAQLGGEIKKIGGAILDTAKEIGASTVSGAIAGARASTEGARAGAAAGTFAAQNAIPLMIFGGVAVIAILLLRK